MVKHDLAYIWGKYLHPKNKYELDLTPDGLLLIKKGLTKDVVATFTREVATKDLVMFLESLGFVDKYEFSIE